MTQNLIDSLKKQYEIYDIDDAIFDEIYNDAINSVVPDDSVNIDYQQYWQMKRSLDNYIMKQIREGNDDYKMFLSLNSVYIIKKYTNVKKIDIEIDNMRDHEKDRQKRLLKYYDALSDEVVDHLVENYDCNSTLEKQYVKELNKKFKK